jgi:hypothetical protein
MSDFPRVRRPCDECPWRRDALPERFSSCRYEVLQNTVGSRGREAGIAASIQEQIASGDVISVSGDFSQVAFSVIGGI